MPCYRPVPGRQDKPGGRVKLFPALGTANLSVPCGTCVGCRSKRAAEWATRCVHEAQQHAQSCFVTLTYRPEALPYGGDLEPRDLALFLKRVRNAVRRRTEPDLVGERMRYLACGEYGEAGDRPHYHALLFGVSFRDGKPVGRELFMSPTLERLWKLGNASFGSVTGASAAYVAQYSLKKQSRGEWKECTDDGVIKNPPFLRCSTRPGIGSAWLKKYRTDARHGYLVVDGEKVAVPRFYQKLLEVTDVGLAEESKQCAYEAAMRSQRWKEDLVAGEAIALRKQELMNPRKFNL